MNNLNEKIKRFRIKSNLSQSELAKLLSVSDKTISSWENSRTIPDIEMIFKLAEIFHISFYALIYDEYYNLNNKEIEIKLKVEDTEWNRILKSVKSNSVFLNEENHLATYYVPIKKRFENEWLRIRKENEKYILNYKRKTEYNSCDEYETLIDNAEALDNILKCLEFKKIGNIDKKRTKYLYNQKYEISFDEVKNIGTFIEIEIKKIENSIEEEYESLIKLLTELNISQSLIDIRRYPDYLIEGQYEKA